MKIINKTKSYLNLGRLYLADQNAARLIIRIRENHLTFLDPIDLIDLYEETKRIEKERIPGIIIEAGVALGGSAIVITYTKKASRPIFLYDTFDMIPPPSPMDDYEAHERYHEIASGQAKGLKGDLYYGYQPDLYNKVRSQFLHFQLSIEERQIHMVKGLFQDTLNVQKPVALAHLDCDWYESVMTCLKRIEPNLVLGGTMVINDYFDWSGCKRAVDEYFENKKSQYKFIVKSRLHILRTS